MNAKLELDESDIKAAVKSYAEARGWAVQGVSLDITPGDNDPRGRSGPSVRATATVVPREATGVYGR